MKKGLYSYLLILGVLLFLWYIALGYFPFLMCLLFVVIFLINLLVSYQGMKTTRIDGYVQQSIIERTEEVQIIFQRHSISLFPIGNIVVEYRILDAFHQCITHQKFILEGEEYILKLPVKHCGYYELKIDKIYCYDILQCLYKTHIYTKEFSYYVFPSLISNPVLLQETFGEQDESIEYSPYHIGDDYSEIFDLRNYREADSLRHIHWKASLKRDELLVKEGSQPIIKKILLAVEINRNDISNDVKLDRFYSICLSFIQRQIAFEILCPQVETKMMVNELITHNHYFKECMKRIMQIPEYSIYNFFYNQPDIYSMYVITKDGIEVYEK